MKVNFIRNGDVEIVKIEFTLSNGEKKVFDNQSVICLSYDEEQHKLISNIYFKDIEQAVILYNGLQDLSDIMNEKLVTFNL